LCDASVALQLFLISKHRFGENPVEGVVPMSICISNFAADTTNQVSAQTIAGAVSEARQAVGYSFEQLAVTTGLTVDELVAVEDGKGADPALLQRIASGLGLPAAAFLVA
jgi:hypothetical protein